MLRRISEGSSIDTQFVCVCVEWRQARCVVLLLALCGVIEYSDCRWWALKVAREANVNIVAGTWGVLRENVHLRWRTSGNRKGIKPHS